jgi:hypothetical protein
MLQCGITRSSAAFSIQEKRRNSPASSTSRPSPSYAEGFLPVEVMVEPKLPDFARSPTAEAASGGRIEFASSPQSVSFR